MTTAALTDASRRGGSFNCGQRKMKHEEARQMKAKVSCDLTRRRASGAASRTVAEHTRTKETGTLGQWSSTAAHPTCFSSFSRKISRALVADSPHFFCSYPVDQFSRVFQNASRFRKYYHTQVNELRNE